LAAALVATTVWGYVLLDRTPDWFPWLRLAVAVAGALGALAILALPWLGKIPKLAVGLVAGLGLAAALAAPLFSTVATAATPHSGAIPTVTPTPSGGLGGPGGLAFGRGSFPRGAIGRFRPGGTAGGAGGAFPSGGFTRRGFTPPGAGGTAGGGGLPGAGFTRHAFGGGGFGGAGGGVGGILNSSTPAAALTKLLEADAGHYTWVAATTNSNSAAGYQLATDDPVMAIGGFNGTDPAPTLTQFEKYVAEGKIHYYIGGGGGGFAGFGGGGGSGNDVATQIASWVSSHYTATTVDGTTIYNLTAPRSSTTPS
jgi:hypothetical protein